MLNLNLKPGINLPGFFILMKEHTDNIIKWIKEKKIKGCITGSCLLDYFEGADVDFFAYTEKAFTEMFYAMYHDKMFQILDPLEKWKADKFISDPKQGYTGITTIKFVYNTCVPVNVIYKAKCESAFDVLASFDMDIIAKAYDTFLGKELDLTGNSTVTKTASWNKWNPNFYSPELWQISRILRQLTRVIKYYKRGYNTDAVCLKYMELIDDVQKFQNIFNSNDFSEKLKIRKKNTKIVRDLCEVWLKTHEITDEQLELLTEKIKEI